MMIIVAAFTKPIAKGKGIRLKLGSLFFIYYNQFMGMKEVLYKLHFQKQYTQTKLIRVIKGSVVDVAVDFRSDAKTHGK